MLDYKDAVIYGSETCCWDWGWDLNDVMEYETGYRIKDVDFYIRDLSHDNLFLMKEKGIHD